jgi:hypothetical protein
VAVVLERQALPEAVVPPLVGLVVLEALLGLALLELGPWAVGRRGLLVEPRQAGREPERLPFSTAESFVRSVPCPDHSV